VCCYKYTSQDSEQEISDGISNPFSFVNRKSFVHVKSRLLSCLIVTQFEIRYTFWISNTCNSLYMCTPFL